MRNGVIIGGLPEGISWLEEVSTERGGISNSGRPAIAQTQVWVECRAFAASCRTAAWWPVWQHLWLTGPGERKGELCPWHGAVRAIPGENKNAWVATDATVIATSSEIARLVRVILPAPTF
jgi:hypothetical protein